MLAVLLRIYKTEGISGLYRGFGATMLNTFSMRASHFKSMLLNVLILVIIRICLLFLLFFCQELLY